MSCTCALGVVMLSDHYVSSLPSRDGLGNEAIPFSPTRDASGGLSQRLDEHLLEGFAQRVQHRGTRIAATCLATAAHCPHRGFRRRQGEKPFLWQNRAFDLAEGLRLAGQAGVFRREYGLHRDWETLANGRIPLCLGRLRTGRDSPWPWGFACSPCRQGTPTGKARTRPEDLAVLVGGRRRS